MKNDTSELKSGWLEEDMKRAADQVAKWKIKKFESSNLEDDSEQVTVDTTYPLQGSQDTLSC